MTEHYVQTISMAYSVFEDRLELRCKSGENSYQIWLTQRMWRQLNQPIVNWLRDSGVGSDQASEFVRDSFEANKAEPVEIPSALGSSQSKSGHQSENALSHGLANAQEAVDTTQWIRAPWLCTTANLQMSGQAIRIRFESQCSDENFIFSMSALEASHFLLAQRNALKTSDWFFEWPSWLSFDEEKQPQPESTFLH